MSAGCTGERTRNCIQAGEYVAVCWHPRCLLHMPLWRVLLPIVSGVFTSAAGSFRDLGRCQPAGIVLRRAGAGGTAGAEAGQGDLLLEQATAGSGRTLLADVFAANLAGGLDHGLALLPAGGHLGV